MAKQIGTHRIVGTTGEMTYEKTKDGFRAREKTHVDGNKIKTGAAYARTRENMAEFGRAGKASKLLRAAFSKIIKGNSDTRMTSRLTGAFSRVIKTDPVNDRGLRIVSQGDIMLLESFDFNIDSSLITTFSGTITGSVDRATGQCIVNIPAFNPATDVNVPEGSTHLRMVSAAGALDFDEEQYTSDFQVSPNLPITNVSVAPFSLTAAVPPLSPFPLFLLVGVQFIQVVNSKEYPLKNGAFNALILLKVDPA